MTGVDAPRALSSQQLRDTAADIASLQLQRADPVDARALRRSVDHVEGGDGVGGVRADHRG